MKLPLSNAVDDTVAYHYLAHNCECGQHWWDLVDGHKFSAVRHELDTSQSVEKAIFTYTTCICQVEDPI